MRVCHRTGEGWVNQRCTSRCAPSAVSTRCWVRSRPVSPNTDSRSGRSSAPAPAVSRASASGRRSAGDGTPRSVRSRRHSSACQARSTASRVPVESTSSPARRALEQLGALRAVAGEEIRRTAGGQPTPAAAGLLRRATPEMAPQQRRPLLVAGLVEDRQDRPHRPRRMPRVGVGIDVGHRSEHGGHQPPDRGEVDPGADPEPIRHLLGQPALHPARGHSHDLGRERVGQRVGQQLGQTHHQPVGALGTVQVETHGGPEPRHRVGQSHGSGRRTAAAESVP